VSKAKQEQDKSIGDVRVGMVVIVMLCRAREEKNDDALEV
jgi:hypothetical protein